MCIMSIIVVFTGFISPYFFSHVILLSDAESGNKGNFCAPVGVLWFFATGGIWERGVVPEAASTGSPKSGFKKFFQKNFIKTFI